MARKPDDWMPLYIGDYLADTSHLGAVEHGAYLLLLMHYWRTAAALPDDDTLLARIARATATQWKAIGKTIRAFFKPALVDGERVLTHTRVERELSYAKAMTEKRSNAGRTGSQTRWQTDSKRIANASVCHKQTDSKTDSKRIANTWQTTWQNDAPHQVPEPVPVPEPEEAQRPSPVPLDSKKSKKNGSFGKNGMGSSVTIADESERLARFQAWLARKLGPDGWSVVTAATDPASPDHAKSLALCKAKTKEMGKGWPYAWGAP